MRTGLALALATVIGGIAAATAQAQASPDPYEVYARSRAYWMHQRYPAQLQYQVAIAVTAGGVSRVERYDTVYDALNNAISVDPVSDFERAHPAYPGSSVNYALGPYRFSKRSDPGDLLGVPRLAPNYSFGMAPFVPAISEEPAQDDTLIDAVRRDYGDSLPSPNVRARFPVIGSVYSTEHTYSIALLGSELVAGHDCYHLAFTPERDPSRYRIREAWIDHASFAPWKLVDASNFRNGAANTVSWTIDFADVNGAHYISRERANTPITQGGTTFSSAVVSFENLREREGSFPLEMVAPSAYPTLGEPQ